MTDRNTSLISPFDELLGTRVERADAEGAVLVVSVTPSLHQPDGLVHGGVYATLVEHAASLSANHWLQARRVPAASPESAVGVSNHTDFLRGVRDGQLRAEASPLQRGRTLQLWQVDVTDEQGRLVAHGMVKLANVPRGG